MRSRGLVVAIAIVLAVAAAVGVIVYTNQVRDQALTENTVDVIVSTQDIPAATDLNPLIDASVFVTQQVPEDQVVVGAVRTLTELQDQVTSSAILAMEQIPASRLATGESNNVGVSDGHQALTFDLDGPRGGGGTIQGGDNVAVYVTYAKGTPVTYKDLKSMLNKASLQKFLDAVAAAGGSIPLPGSAADITFVVMPFDFTLQIVQTVKVLGIQNPEINADTGRTNQDTITVTLDLLPNDARDMVYASEDATGLWLALLPPNDKAGFPVQGTFGPGYAKAVAAAEKVAA